MQNIKKNVLKLHVIIFLILHVYLIMFMQDMCYSSVCLYRWLLFLWWVLDCFVGKFIRLDLNKFCGCLYLCLFWFLYLLFCHWHWNRRRGIMVFQINLVQLHRLVIIFLHQRHHHKKIILLVIIFLTR